MMPPLMLQDSMFSPFLGLAAAFVLVFIVFVLISLWIN